MKRFSAAVILILFLCQAPAVHAQAPVVPDSRTQITLSFAPLVKQVAPAVVNIYTQRKIQQRISPFFGDPFFKQFFGNMQGFSRERLENSLGSGVIVRADGLIVTSNHVIEGADQIRVVLSDRRELDATVIIADDRTDLAILHIDVKGETLPFLALKDSDQAQVGDLVLAIGDPFGVGQTVTSGIISAVAHGAVGSTDLDYYIQTDAAINPGNSGGALVTMDGKLVGINAAIYSQSGGNLGIGFAVPSNMVRVILDAAEQGKKNIVHPWLGLEGQEVTPTLAASLGMAQPAGILVKRIRPFGPAAKAGLQVGDVIVSVNGQPVDDLDAFHYRVATFPIGSKMETVVLRKGQKLTLSIELTSPPEIPPRDKTEIKGEGPFAGATVENVSPAVIEETGLRNIDNGVVVVGVKDGTNAAMVGLQPGDILLEVNNAKIEKVADVAAASARGAKGWRLSIQRGGQVITIMVGG